MRFLVTEGLKARLWAYDLESLAVCESIYAWPQSLHHNLVYYPNRGKSRISHPGRGFFPITAIVKLFVAGDLMYPIMHIA